MAAFGTIRQKSMVGYLLVLLVILLMGGLYIQAYRYYLNTAVEREKTSLTQLTLERILDDSYNAEISEQRYILTGNPADKTAFQNSMTQLNRHLERVGQLIGNEAMQSRYYRKLAFVTHSSFLQLPTSTGFPGPGKSSLIATEKTKFHTIFSISRRRGPRNSSLRIAKSNVVKINPSFSPTS